MEIDMTKRLLGSMDARENGFWSSISALRYDVHLNDTIEEVGEKYASADIVIIDMPIGRVQRSLPAAPTTKS